MKVVVYLKSPGNLLLMMVVVLLACPPISNGQMQTIKTRPKDWVDITFSAYLVNGKNNDSVQFQEGSGEDQELKFRRKRFSNVYRYRGPTSLLFYKTESLKNGELKRVPLGVLKLKSEAKRLELFFLKNSEGPFKYQVIAIPESKSTQQQGTLRVLNASNQDLVCKIGTKVFSLKNQQLSSSLDIASEGDEDSYISIALAAKMSNTYHRIYRNHTPFRADKNTVLIIGPKKRSNSWQLPVYRVILPAKASESVEKIPFRAS